MTLSYQDGESQYNTLSQQYPILLNHCLMYSTDAAKELVQNNLRHVAEKLAKILDSCGHLFKARIIRENILGKQ